MNALIQDVHLAVTSLNQVVARVAVQVQLCPSRPPGMALRLQADISEWGTDGSLLDTALVITEPVSLTVGYDPNTCVNWDVSIGTPFLCNPQSQPRYLLRVKVFQNDGLVELTDIPFAFAADGSLLRLDEPPPSPIPTPVPDTGLPAVFVVGDSTAFSNGPNQRGWGDELARHLPPGQWSVRNHARPGRSTRSFRREGLWQRVLAELKPGDLVLIQFGHNDADTLDTGRHRGVLPGLGDETCEVFLPDHHRETVHTFGWYLNQFVTECRTLGALPVLLSCTVKNVWQNDRLSLPRDHYSDWSAAAAANAGVPFLDLNRFMANFYETLGEDAVRPLFCSAEDTVHTSLAGASVNAECVASFLKSLVLPPVIFGPPAINNCSPPTDR